MKKTISTLFIALFCAVSHAQVNPKITQLFDRLSESGGSVVIRKTGGQNNPTLLEYRKELFLSETFSYLDIPAADSLQRESKKRVLQNVADIRHTLDELQEEAVETYRYEHRGNGRDSVYCSMNFCRDTANVKKYPSRVLPVFFSDEHLRFEYLGDQGTESYGGLLTYSVALPQPDSLDATYTKETLTADIQRLFKQHRIKPRKALWQHDKAYSEAVWRDDNDHNFIHQRKINNYSLEGVTDATIYTVPLDQEQLAWQILAEIDTLALHYTNIQDELFYNYIYNTTFCEPFWACMLSTFDLTAPTLSDYELGICRDDYGFHYVIAQTKGTLWVPRDWPCLKSFINGKKTCFKGMEQKYFKDLERGERPTQPSGPLNIFNKDK